MNANYVTNQKERIMEPFTGTIAMYPWDWPPREWSLCQGQLVAISQNPALFSLLDTNFGGDGRTNFGLPDLRGRHVIGQGDGPGLTPKRLGERMGTEWIRLTQSNLPPHTHTLTASDTDSGDLTQAPAADWTLGAAASVTVGRTPVTTPVQMYGPSNPSNPVQSAPTSSTGEGSDIPNMPPYLCLNFCIALFGIFPSRN
jgi:microcystin-dependent protein